MINSNKPIARIVLVAIVIFTGIYLFTTSTVHQDNPIKEQGVTWDDDYFAYTTSSWTYENPTNLTFPHQRFKAAFVTFVKSDTASLTKLRFTIRNIEDQFNRNHNYPYIIFTDQELSEEYMELASTLTQATVRFERVENDLYGYHPSTDLKRAAQARIDLQSTMFGDSEDYRFQSRFMAGTIYRHALMQDLDYSWRFEAGTEYICPMDEDPFQYMFEKKLITSFSVALYEYKETIPSLYNTVLDFASKNKDWIQPASDPKTLWHFILDGSNSFNGCHFWNNFQVSLSFFDHVSCM
ncbi:glycolipid 2-alpha-mannosyltransferase-domain-containing protein [Mucor mucedo]|uniref:glycolipid 2-alpha-mannosyltransferase-domain-containing protein n=1 Tax=Mucor mucedo TaxID=29922 RepID=UPI00222046EF|nr:glycolipid 2-alpha-mannosyltransferase-domain-containing protein [Mucor mucedo]KAI7896119.1 glycolipid 2-alpha-mannosyltransferase-domain-containing protein [Mucor mucedo]